MESGSFSKTWNSSVQARKQRKFRYNAPLHIRQKFLHAHLSKELRAKHNTRVAQLHKGDKVRVLRGQFRLREGVVDRISLHFGKVYLTGLDVVKRNGSKVLVALEPSNLLIIELELKDKRRKDALDAQRPQSRSAGALTNGSKPVATPKVAKNQNTSDQNQSKSKVQKQ